MSYCTKESQNAITQRLPTVARASVRTFIRTVHAEGMGEQNFDFFAIALPPGCPESIAVDLETIAAGALPLECV
jgi:hypothetical protein